MFFVTLQTLGGTFLAAEAYQHSERSERPGKFARWNCAKEAMTIGADAVVAVEFDFSPFSMDIVPGGMVIVAAYGTAVRLRDGVSEECLATATHLSSQYNPPDLSAPRPPALFQSRN